ncbi:MAG: helix-turn-helix domain-containing protein [Brevundimonas sp.]
MNDMTPIAIRKYGPDPIDVTVGAAIRFRRKEIDQSQSALAEALGVTFQQVQKYERGTNRISASMLVRAANAQGKDPGYYFNDVSKSNGALPDQPEAIAFREFHASEQGLSLSSAVSKLTPDVRRVVLSLARDLGAVNA